MRKVVVYITENWVKFCEAGESQDKTKLSEIDISSLKKEDIPHSIKNLLKNKKIQPEHLILVVPRNQAYIRYFYFPATNDGEIHSMLEYDLTDRFAYKTEELVFDHAVIEKSGDGFSRVLLAVVPRDEILPKFSLLKHSGLVPDEAYLSTVSLFNQIINRKKPVEKCLVVYFDDGFAEILYVSQGKLEFSRAINFKSGETDSLIKEIKHTIIVLNAENRIIERAILSGKLPPGEQFISEFGKLVENEVEIDDSLDTLKGFMQENRLLKLSLLPEEFKIRKVKERRARSLVYLGILLLLNLSLIANIAFFKMKAKDEYLYAVKSEIKKIDKQAAALQKKMIKANAVRNYINSGRMKLGLFSEIYRVAPEGIFFSSLDISGNKKQGVVILIGQAPDSERVLKFAGDLKSLVFIEKTDVNYINKRKLPGQNTVDFEIKAGY